MLSYSDDMQAPAAPQKIITSACEYDYPPFCVVDNFKNADGFSVELFRAALKAMGYDVSFKVGPWDEVKGWLEKGKIQALPLVGRTPERENLFDFTFAYLTLHGAIVVREGTNDVRDLQDLSGRKVAVMRGDNAEEFLRRNKPNFNIINTSTFEDALCGLRDGKFDAVVAQRLVALRLIKEKTIKNIKVVNKPLEGFSQDFCFAVHEGDKDTLALLNEGLSLVMADGTYRRLYAKWFGSLELPSNRKVIVGGDDNFPPYEFLDKNGNPTGFNVELIRAIARETGLDIEIRLGSWAGIREGLLNGDIDLLEGIFYTQKRGMLYDFSLPHSTNSYVIISQKNSKNKYENIDNLKGARVAVQEGDVAHDLLLEHKIDCKMTVTNSQEEALSEVVNDRADCAIVARMSALYIMEKNGWKNLSISMTPLASLEYCFAVKKGNTALLSQINDGLKILEDNGEYRRIYYKWMGIYEEPTISFSRALRYFAMIFIPLLVILLIALMWTWALRREVARRTEALFESERNYREIFNATSEAIFIDDAETGRMIDVNDSMLRMYGYDSKEEVLSGNIGDLSANVYPFTQIEAKRRLELSLKGEPQTFEWLAKKKNGETFWAEVSLRSSEIAGKRRILAVARDISERKRVETALLESQQLARATMDSLSAHICVLNFEGDIIAVNKAWRDFAEQNSENKEINVSEGANYFKACEMSYGKDQETAVNFARGIRDVMAGRLDYFSLEYPCHSETEQRWFIGKVTRFAGEAKGKIVVAHENITDRKLAEEEAYRWKYVFDKADFGLAYSNAVNNTFITVNPSFARQRGYTPEELKGKPIATISAPEEREKMLKRNIEFEKAEHLIYETVHIRKDGSRFPVLMEVTVIRDAEGRQTSRVAYALDITDRKRAEKARMESEEKFSLAFMTSPYSITITTLKDGKIIEANEGFTKLTGYSRGEALVKTTPELGIWVNVEDRDQVIDDLAKGVKVEGREIPFRKKDGVLITGLFSAAYITINNERCILSSVLDITERKKMEETLLEHQRFLSAVQHIATLGGWKANPHTNYLEWTEGVYDIIESSKQNKLGFIEGMKYYMPKYVPILQEKIRLCLETGEPFVLDAEIITAAGKRRWVEARGLSPVRDGEKSYVIGTMQDITIRKSTETELRRLYDALNSSVNEIYMFDSVTLKFEFVSETAKKNLKYSFHQLQYMTPLDIKPEYTYESFTKLVEPLKSKEKQVLVFETIHRRADGSEYPVEVHLQLMGDERPIFLAVIMDITERKKLEAQFLQAQKMEVVGQLAGGIAHDFNNLLQAINGYSDLAMDDLDPEHPARASVEEVLKAGERAKKLVSQLLAFSRKQVMRMKVLDPNEIVANMIKMLSRILGENISISFIPNYSTRPIYADRGQIEQVIMNLALNARDAMPNGGVLSIESESFSIDKEYCKEHPWAIQGEYSVLSITDSGTGMSEETRKHLFEPFFTTKEIGRGTGLGLATIYGIVKQHKGFIHVYSEIGKGARFRIYLPEAEMREVEESQQESASTAVCGGNETLLVAEDDPKLRELSRQILSKAGYNVILAQNGEEAINICSERGGEISLAILDVVMPVMGGYEVFETIKNDYPNMRFLFASGYSINAVHTNFILKDGLELIQKPFSQNQILKKIREILDKQTGGRC